MSGDELILCCWHGEQGLVGFPAGAGLRLVCPESQAGGVPVGGRRAPAGVTVSGPGGSPVVAGGSCFPVQSAVSPFAGSTWQGLTICIWDSQWLQAHKLRQTGCSSWALWPLCLHIPWAQTTHLQGTSGPPQRCNCPDEIVRHIRHSSCCCLAGQKGSTFQQLSDSLNLCLHFRQRCSLLSWHISNDVCIL